MSSRRKKTLIILLFLVLVALTVEAMIIFRPKKDNTIVKFTFIENETHQRTLEVGTEFSPSVVNVFINDEDYTNKISIDQSKLDINKLGTYEVIYSVTYNDKIYSEVETVTVVDTESPEITLKGKNVTILVGEEYTEPGFDVTDNYDKDLKEKVIIKKEIDNQKPGTYKVTYTISDTSGNKTEASREVVVKKPNVIIVEPPKEVKVEVPKVVETGYTNTIKKNKFNTSNITLEGYLKEPLEENKIKLVGTDTYEYDITIKDNHYTISLDPETINNGKYKMYINEEPVLNKMAFIEKINRAKVGSKLVTFSYDNDEVSISVENHSYAYDILINPGHGDTDTGAVNEYITEKEMNLKVSMYEKCRYEAHGLRVYMTRTTDNYGDKMGPTSLIRLHRVAYEMGYYGAVSKIVYSNHHNSIGNNYYSGYEVLIAGAIPKSELTNELALVNKWNSIYTLTENHKRFYARDYDTEAIYSKLNGETYTFKDNYAVNRIPYQVFNVKSIIYEGCYMSNKKEFLWYWQDEAWHRVSEAKIETYVTSLGISYNSDNSSCL